MSKLDSGLTFQQSSAGSSFVPTVRQEGEVKVHTDSSTFQPTPKGSKHPPKPKRLQLVEVYESVKGEGTQAGIPMMFVRFSKCNLDCSWCDTPYNRIAIQMTEEMLFNLIKERMPAWVVFTGGEPCLQLSVDLVLSLTRLDIKSAIETNGMIWTDALKFIHYINVSPKLDYPLHKNFKGIGISECRFTLADGQNDLWNVFTGQPVPPLDQTTASSPLGITATEELIGIKTDHITISPLMLDSKLSADFKSGDGFPSQFGTVDQASLNKCLFLVQKYKHLKARLSTQVHKFIGQR